MQSSYTSSSAPAQRKDSMTAFAPIARKHNSLVKTKILFATLLTLAFFTAGYAQTLDKAKLDQFFDRLAEKNKAMGSLTIAKDTLDKFFPQIPNAKKITIVQILSHRSGIPNVRRDQNSQGNMSTIPITKDEMLALIVKATPDFEPDSKQSYSNSGYFLLGLILEKLTGKPYEEALKERITSKIGLADTYTATGNIDVNKNESLTYIHFGGDWKQVRETHPSILFGWGAIVSTPNDLAKFIQALFDGKIVSKDNLDQMKTKRDGDGLGLGMEPFTFAGKTFYGHAGGGDNY